MMRRFWTTGMVTLTLLLLVLASFWNTSIAQQPLRGIEAPPPPAGWRYQMIAWGTQHNALVLWDTHTGRAWSKEINGKWVDLDTPPSQERAGGR